MFIWSHIDCKWFNTKVKSFFNITYFAENIIDIAK